MTQCNNCSYCIQYFLKEILKVDKFVLNFHGFNSSGFVGSSGIKIFFPEYWVTRYWMLSGSIQETSTECSHEFLRDKTLASLKLLCSLVRKENCQTRIKPSELNPGDGDVISCFPNLQ